MVGLGVAGLRGTGGGALFDNDLWEGVIRGVIK